MPKQMTSSGSWTLRTMLKRTMPGGASFGSMPCMNASRNSSKLSGSSFRTVSAHNMTGLLREGMWSLPTLPETDG